MEKTENGKIKVVGVRFRTAGKIYYFDPGEFELTRGRHVIVETARGMEYGFVVGTPMEVDAKTVPQPLKAVLRISTQEDDEREQRNREKEREAFRVCRERIRRRNLDMKLIDAEYTFDNSKVLFYFTADGRVDFRELVKDLAGVFRTRIELRQVGVRDETKILGGYGSCGRPLCCHTWLSDFVPVSIKMAKEQNLSLNPGKISGVCGRLMCCLKNEAETYEELNKALPHPGDEVESSDGLNGLVESVNILRQTARIIVEVDDEKELHEYHVDELTILRRRKRGASRPSMKKNAQQNGGKEKEGKEGGRHSGRGGKEGKEGRESRGSRNGRDEREGRENREGNGGRENREGREGNSGRESRESRRVARDNREHRENRENRDEREGREGRNSRENHEGREGRNGRDEREGRENREGNGGHENREGRESRSSRRRRERERRRMNAAGETDGANKPVPADAASQETAPASAPESSPNAPVQERPAAQEKPAAQEASAAPAQEKPAAHEAPAAPAQEKPAAQEASAAPAQERPAAQEAPAAPAQESAAAPVQE